MSVAPGNGDGTFRVPRLLRGIERSRLLAAADLDGNGIDELILASPLFAWAGRLAADGTYRFEQVAWVDAPFALAVGNVLPGGGEEIVIGEKRTLRVVSSPARGATSTMLLNFHETMEHLAVASLSNGDGGEIIAVTRTDAGTYNLHVFRDEASVFSVPVVGVQPDAKRPERFRIETGDVDHDGAVDVILTVHYFRSGPDDFEVAARGYVAVFRGHGDGALDPAQFLLRDAAIYASAVVDVNRDGRLDILINAPGQSTQFLGTGDGKFTARFLNIIVPELFADLDLDGLLDAKRGPCIHYGVATGFEWESKCYLQTAIGDVLARRDRLGKPSLIGVVNIRGDLVVNELTPKWRERREIERR